MFLGTFEPRGAVDLGCFGSNLPALELTVIPCRGCATSACSQGLLPSDEFPPAARSASDVTHEIRTWTDQDMPPNIGIVRGKAGGPLGRLRAGAEEASFGWGLILGASKLVEIETVSFSPFFWATSAMR